MSIFSKKQPGTSGETSSSALRIVLEHGGTPLYELRTGEYSREIVIGRGRDCTWSLDGVDLSASTRHAMISRRKQHFYITDLGSRNGIFYQNKRVREKKLEIGDKFSLGECTISVDVIPETAKKVSRFHRLVYANEKGRKIILDVSKPQMVLGSGKECDVVFQDQLISSRHAELLLKSDGSCWLKDLGSRNGTSVNGMELPPENERMLQDNDVITIAYLDLRFWDASVEHQESRIWPAAIAVTVTIVLILGAYVGYGKLTPNAPKLIEIAAREMQAGRFDSAKKILNDSVPYAENAADTQYQREQLLRRMTQWESIIAIWKSVRTDLNVRRFSRATQKLSSINNEDLNSWTWPGGAIEKRKATAIKDLLDACSISSSGLKNMLTTVEDVEQIRRELVRAIAEASKFKDDYFVSTVAFSKPFLERIENTLADDKELQKTLVLLEQRTPDYPAIQRRLEKISRESRGPVKVRADRVLPAVVTLGRETMRTLAMVDKVCELDFQTVREFRLDLPEGIDYSTEKNIGTLRNRLIETVGRFKDTALQLSLIHGALVKRGIAPGKQIPVLEPFLNPAEMDKVIAVDTLDFPLPKSARSTPSGVYDRMLGVEFFYDYISNIHTRAMTVNIDELPFRPTIFLLKENLSEIQKFIVFSDKDENQWFNRGAFAEYLKYCREILARRNTVIDSQRNRPDRPGTREFLISRGIAAYLSPDGPAKTKLEEEVEKSFAGLKRKVLELNREYNIAMPEEALRFRREIIAAGLPGDPVLKKMWQQRPENGWGK